MILLKIGGSILTDKRKECTIVPEKLTMIAKQIADSDVKELILIHGAGSFGHPQALKHLQRGFNANGIWITHKTVSQLNSVLIEELQAYGIGALPVHPLNCSISNSGMIEHFDLNPLKMMLENNIVPVIHGDVVLDKYIKFSVLSGDQIIAHLARELKPHKVGVGTNVDGVLYKGNTLRYLHPADFDRLKQEIKGSDSTDVTGGMLKKVTELVELANFGISSQIFNANVAGNITKFLTTFNEFGTFITKKDDNR
jgi:isopentenyl phosphate kinase